MAKANQNYLQLPGNYLFSTIAQKVREYQESHPGTEVIRLGIGDVTQPIAPEIIRALHSAVDEMGQADTFRGYAPDLGYDFLRETIAEYDFRSRGCDISADEIFISDGAKCDCSNIQEIFSTDNTIAVCDPVYPVYVDSNVMAGRTGPYDAADGCYRDVVYMPCTADNGFAPELPKPSDGKAPDLIYLCFPNNPTGAVMTKDRLQEWVDYANRHGSIILYDAAYEAFISEDKVPHSIYEWVLLQDGRLHGPAPGLYRHPEGSGGGRGPSPSPLGQTPRDQVQRRSLYHPEGRSGCLFGEGKTADQGPDRLLHAQREVHSGGTARRGL